MGHHKWNCVLELTKVTGKFGSGWGEKMFVWLQALENSSDYMGWKSCGRQRGQEIEV